MKLKDLIFNELDRLGVSANQDPCSGLMTAKENSAPYSPEGDDIDLIRIYDDHSGGFYDGSLLLAFLKECDPDDVNLEYETPRSIWGLIREFEY